MSEPDRYTGPTSRNERPGAPGLGLPTPNASPALPEVIAGVADVLGSSTSAEVGGEPVLDAYTHEGVAALILGALRALPVEQRMEAMGMESTGGTVHGKPFLWKERR